MIDLKVIEEAICHKIRSAHYHKVMSERSYFNGVTGYDEYAVSGFEFTAMMTTLHSILDLLAQWVNIKQDLNLGVSRLSFKNIIGKVNNKNLKDKMVLLKEDTIYLDDFCNYTKHRNIVKVSYAWYFVSPFQPAVAEDIEPFERGGRKHPSQSLYRQRNQQFNTVYQASMDITGLHIVLSNND